MTVEITTDTGSIPVACALFHFINFTKMAYNKQTIMASKTAAKTFTVTEVGDFSNGTLKLAGIDLIRMRRQVSAESDILALELIEILAAEPDLRTGIAWCQPFVDLASGDTVDPFVAIDYSNIDETFFNNARTMATTERSGGTTARQMLSILSFSERLTVGREQKKENIVLTVLLPDGSESTARVNDARLSSIEPLLAVGAVAECSTDSSGLLWVESVIKESAQVETQRAEAKAKAHAELVLETERANKLAAVEGLRNMAGKELDASAQAKVLDIFANMLK